LSTFIIVYNVILDVVSVRGKSPVRSVDLVPKYEDEWRWIPSWKSRNIMFSLKFVELFQSIIVLPFQLCKNKC